MGGSKVGPYAVAGDELARLRAAVRAGALRELASVYPGDGDESLVRFRSADDAARALDLFV